jgi:outer membrane lipoprotein carrier protein
MSQPSSFALLALLTVAALPGQPGASATAQEVAAALQKKYDSIRDFSTDFVHHHEGGVLRRTREERGTLFVKKPGRMRWEYKAPDEKLFVSDGVRVYQYMPEERRVIVGPAPDGDQEAVLFLAGRGNLVRDFNVSFGKAPANAWTLRLEPRRPQTDYDWLEITAAQGTYRLQSFVIAEKQGGRSTFMFSNFKENPGLADKSFEFSIPRGVEVTNAGPVKR